MSNFSFDVCDSDRCLNWLENNFKDNSHNISPAPLPIYTLGNKVEISKINATVSADTESLVIYSGHGYMTYDNK